MALDFLSFVVERHKIWEARQAGLPQPWTEDPILATRKFTNVFRVLDPGSQFVVRQLADSHLSEQDMLARLILYRCTNYPPAWDWLRRNVLGRYPVLEDMTEGLASALSVHYDGGNQIFSPAYVIRPFTNVKTGRPKISTIMQAVRENVPKIMLDWATADTQEERFWVLRSINGVGPFLAMQILTDWGYCPQSEVDREDEFVVMGPGATRGAQAVHPGADIYDTLHWAVTGVRSQPDCPEIGGRKPSWMDVQNCFCEYSKYVGKYKPGNTPYAPAHPGPQPAPTLPAHWRI